MIWFDSWVATLMGPQTLILWHYIPNGSILKNSYDKNSAIYGLEWYVHAPNGHILSEIIENNYWNKWQLQRQEDSDNCKLYNAQFDDLKSETINGIDPSDIGIINGATKSVFDEQKWEYYETDSKDDFDDYDTNTKKYKQTLLDKIFSASKNLLTSGYYYMDGIEFKELPKRQRCHSLKIPTNLTYHGTDILGKKQEFTLEWNVFWWFCQRNSRRLGIFLVWSTVLWRKPEFRTDKKG